MDHWSFFAGLIACLLLWTLAIYLLHRLSHWRHRWNPLFALHRAHHRKPYLRSLPKPARPRWPQYLLWFGDWPSSVDVWINMSLPLVAIALAFPAFGLPLLALHWAYEVFLSEEVLDHNPRVQGAWTRVFAWGDYHLHHHAVPKRNFGLLITLWDHVFGTARNPPPGSALHRIEARLAMHPKPPPAGGAGSR